MFTVELTRQAAITKEIGDLIYAQPYEDCLGMALVGFSKPGHNRQPARIVKMYGGLRINAETITGTVTAEVEAETI